MDNHRVEILVSERHQQAIILLGGFHYKPPTEAHRRGVASAVRKMVAVLAETTIREAIVHCRIKPHAEAQKPADILCVDLLYFKTLPPEPTDRFVGDTLVFEDDADPQIGEAVRHALALIIWSRLSAEERLVEGIMRTGSRSCILCGCGQMARESIFANLPPTKIPLWDADYCTNRRCFSHTIEQNINPDYAIPKAGEREEQKRQNMPEAAGRKAAKDKNMERVAFEGAEKETKK